MTEHDFSEFREAAENEELRKALADSQRQLRRAKAKAADMIAAAHAGAREAMVILGNPPPVAPAKPGPASRPRRGGAASLV